MNRKRKSLIFHIHDDRYTHTHTQRLTKYKNTNNRDKDDNSAMARYHPFRKVQCAMRSKHVKKEN